MTDVLQEMLLHMTSKDASLLALSNRTVEAAINKVEADASYWWKRLELYYPKYKKPPPELTANPRLIYDVRQMLRGYEFEYYFQAMVEMADYYTDAQLIQYVKYLKYMFPKDPGAGTVDLFIVPLLNRTKIVLEILEAYPDLVNWRGTMYRHLFKQEQFDLMDALIASDQKFYKYLYNRLQDGRVFVHLVVKYPELAIKVDSIEQLVHAAIEYKSREAIKVLSKVGNLNVDKLLGEIVSDEQRAEEVRRKLGTGKVKLRGAFLEAIDEENMPLLKVVINSGQFDPLAQTPKQIIYQFISKSSPEIIKVLLQFKFGISDKIANGMLTAAIERVDGITVLQILLQDKRSTNFIADALSISVQKENVDAVAWLLQNYATLEHPVIDINHIYRETYTLLQVAVNLSIHSYSITQLLLAFGANRDSIKDEVKNKLPKALQELLE